MSSTIAPALSDIIGYVESKNDIFAYRFEPGIWTSLSGGPSSAANSILATIQTVHNCSLSTAKAIFSSSFGAQQILAENLYDPHLNLRVTVFEYANNPALQEVMFDRFTQWKNIVYTPSQLLVQQPREHFALIYNGALGYADLILQSLQHYGVSA